MVRDIAGADGKGSRRRVDDTRRRTSPLVRRLRAVGGDGDQIDPLRLGQLLLLACGATQLAASPVLARTAHDWVVLAGVALVMTGVLALTERVPRERWVGPSLLAFPVLVMAALCACTAAAPGLVAPLVGLLTLCFAYLGLTLRPWAALVLVGPASATFVYANGEWTRAIAIRLVIAIMIWILLAEMLAALTAHQRALHAGLHAAAHTDVLTGVANRRDLDLRLTTSAPGDAVIVCDLDHFKVVNDTLGHAAGDRVLADFGAALRMSLRTGDYCARLGGEEFVIVLKASTPDRSLHVSHRLRSNWALLQPDITFSAGIAFCRPDRSSSRTLDAADRALYEAKRAGRNRDHVAGAALPALTPSSRPASPDPQPSSAD